MIGKNPILPQKNRDPLIDTARVIQNEKWVLKILFLLLAATLAYEFGGDYWREWTTAGIEFPDEATEKRRVFPNKRVRHMAGLLTALQQEVPLLRVPIRPNLAALTGVLEQTTSAPGFAVEEMKLRTAAILDRIGCLLEHPVWGAPRAFKPVQAELAALLMSLGGTMSSKEVIPSMAVGPKPIIDLVEPERNIFRSTVDAEFETLSGSGGRRR
jgi:hypothetical protein